MTKVAINGFGRIGRNTLRAAIREGIFNKIDYVAMPIGNEFIVGYGLDYNQLGRNLKDIYVVEE